MTTRGRGETLSQPSCFTVRFMGRFIIHFDPYVYPYGDLQRFTGFSSKSLKPLKIKGFAYTLLQYFHPVLKFKSLLPRQRQPWNRNGSRAFSCPLTLTLTLTGFLRVYPDTLRINCSMRSADCWRIFWETWPYTSRVKLAVAWPRLLCTVLISSPLSMAATA